MPLLGAHMSVAGGLHLAFERIARVKGESLQIFSRNQRQWDTPPVTDEESREFQRAWTEWGGGPVAVHDSYLINLASADEKIREKSIDALAREIERTGMLKVPYLIMHPGSHGGDGAEEGLQRVVKGVDRAMESALPWEEVMILLENTAGQGNALGADFRELAFILDNVADSSRTGVCLDTCHLFAAGYDMRKRTVYEQTVEEFDRLIGIKHLKFFHLNDSLRKVGSRVDRHEHIGKGAIGLEGFRNLLQDERFKGHPMTLETPKEKDLNEDMENLTVLRSLLPSF